MSTTVSRMKLKKKVIIKEVVNTGDYFSAIKRLVGSNFNFLRFMNTYSRRLTRRIADTNNTASFLQVASERNLYRVIQICG